MWHRLMVALVASAVVVGACTSGGAAVNPSRPGSTPEAATTSAPVSSLEPAGQPATPGAPAGGIDPVSLYGHGPQPDAPITYQPDVVLISGGPAAIRGVSPDGLVWTIDASAGGVEQLVAGKVMFASSDAVGRVVDIARHDATVDVTLAPVGIGDVIRDGRLVFDQPVSVDALSFFEVPQIVDGYEDVPSDELTATPAPEGNSGADAAAVSASLASVRWPPPEPPEQADSSEASTKVGGWTLTAYRSAGSLGLRAERGVASSTVQGAELKVALDAHVEVADLRVVADIPVTRGEVGSGHFRVFGIKGLAINLQAGVVNGLSDNRKIRIEVPVQLKQRVIIGGFPATLTQKFKFLVQSAFTAKNGNLTASGTWDVDGSIGVDGSTVSLPTMTARGAQLIDTLAGVSVGVNGIVVAVSFEFGLIFGLPLAGAGPVAAFITSLGLTNGSSLGIVQCKQVSITSTVSAGVGIQVFDPVKKAIKKLLDYDIPENESIYSKNILEEAWVKPDVVACRG